MYKLSLIIIILFSGCELVDLPNQFICSADGFKFTEDKEPIVDQATGAQLICNTN